MGSESRPIGTRTEKTSPSFLARSKLAWAMNSKPTRWPRSPLGALRFSTPTCTTSPWLAERPSYRSTANPPFSSTMSIPTTTRAGIGSPIRVHVGEYADRTAGLRACMKLKLLHERELAESPHVHLNQNSGV